MTLTSKVLGVHDVKEKGQTDVAPIDDDGVVEDGLSRRPMDGPREIFLPDDFVVVRSY